MNKLQSNTLRHPGLWTQPSQSITGEWQTGNITTLATSTEGVAELKQFASQLATLSLQGRWIVLINPPSVDYKQLLARAGVRMDRLLLVHGKDEVETLWATEKALTSGTSSAVISWTQGLDAKERRRLQLVAKSARALGIVLESGSQVSLDANNICKITQFSSVH